MKKTTVYCDICGLRFEGVLWWDHPTRLEIHTHCDAQNPMGEIGDKDYQKNKFVSEDTCRDCQKAIARACADAIKQRMQP